MPAAVARVRPRVVEATRALAAQVWRGGRSPVPYGVAGLNSEATVRARLARICRELLALPNLPIAVAEVVRLLEVERRPPLHVLERTEDLLEHVAGHLDSVDALVAETDPVVRHLVRLAVVQSVGGRLGWWAVRGDEIPDARIARALYRDGPAVDWSHYTDLVDRGAACFAQRDFARAVQIHLELDRLVRTPTGKIHIAVSLCHLGDFVGALWAIRSCLLEPHTTFESPRSAERARTLRDRLAALVAERQLEPLEAEEVELLGGDTHEELQVEDLHRARMAQRRMVQRVYVQDRWRPAERRTLERPAPRVVMETRPLPIEVPVVHPATEVEAPRPIDFFAPEDRATEELAFATLDGPRGAVLIADTAEIIAERRERFVATERIRVR